MDKALLDTDIFSEILKGKDQQVVRRANSYHATFGRYTSSLITLLEFVKGYQKAQRKDRIQQILMLASSVEWLTLDLASAETAGRMMGELERTGQPIGCADPLIAAIAGTNDLTLVPGNTHCYQHIQQLGYPLKLDNGACESKAKGRPGWPPSSLSWLIFDSAYGTRTRALRLERAAC